MNDELDISAAPESCVIPCPRCSEPSGSIKVVNFAVVVFLIIFFITIPHKVVVCPSCMRKQLIRNLLVNLFTLHLVWPVYAVIAGIIVLTRSFIPGHSQELIDALKTLPKWEPREESPRSLDTSLESEKHSPDTFIKKVD